MRLALAETPAYLAGVLTKTGPAGRPMTTEKLNYLYDKYNVLTEGFFHNFLWQLMINGAENGYVRGQHAVTYVYLPRKGQWNMGITHRGKKGYTPACFGVKPGVSEEDRDNMIDELNAEIFGITRDLADEIVFSSF